MARPKKEFLKNAVHKHIYIHKRADRTIKKVQTLLEKSLSEKLGEPCMISYSRVIEIMAEKTAELIVMEKGKL